MSTEFTTDENDFSKESIPGGNEHFIDICKHTQTYIYIYTYIVRVRVCVCVCV